MLRTNLEQKNVFLVRKICGEDALFNEKYNPSEKYGKDHIGIILNYLILLT